MTNLAAVFGRVPKYVLFGAAGLIQAGLIGLMVADRIMILRTGTDVKLETRPLDPRDLLRGDYVTLGYDISSLHGGVLKELAQESARRDTPVFVRGTPVFVKLSPNPDGFYEAVSVHAAPVDVSNAEVLIRGRVASGYCGGDVSFCTLQVRYGIESYFVPEGEGGKLEAARNQRKLAVVAAVAPTGRAAIKRLLIDGEPVYDEPWF
jgi:uncharacterized membrane-anchored protein